MLDLERRALLGDKKAQEECTRQGIVLPCPCCGQTMIKDDSWICHPNVKCILGLQSFKVTDTELISLWNTRPAPPVGMCKDCANLIRGGTGYGWCDSKEKFFDQFCSNFRAKEKG